MIKDQRDILSKLWWLFFEKQKGNILLWYVVTLCIGILIYFSLRFEPNPHILYSLTLVSAALIVIFRKNPSIKICTISIFMISLGMSVSVWRTHSLSTHLLYKDLRAQMITGTVQSFEPAAIGWRIILSDLKFEKLNKNKKPSKIRVTIRQKDYQPQYQQRIKVYARVMAPSAPIVPGVYDFQRHAYFQGIGGYGFSLGTPEIINSGFEKTGLIVMMRHKIAQKILRHLSQPNSGIINALLTGQKKTIHNRVRNDLRDAGLAHLLAISGLHVGLLAGIIFYFSRILLVILTKPDHNIPIKKISAFIALISSILYMLLVGSPVSTQRAVIMTGLVLIAVMTDRRAITLRLVAIAAFIILILQPESLIQPGFQMSFSAVIGLVTFYRGTEQFWRKFRYRAGLIRKSLIYPTGAIVTTVIATISTAPFALYHFQQISVFGFLANMLAMPIMAFWVMPMGVLSYISMLAGLEYWPLNLMTYGVFLIRIIAESVAHMDGAVKLFPLMSALTLFILSSGFLILSFVKGVWRFIGILPLFIGAVMIMFPIIPIAMVSGSGQLMVYVPSTPSKEILISQKEDRFTTDLLKQLAGRAEINIWENSINKDEFSCDDWGCIAKRQDKVIAFSKHPAALDEDCKKVDLLIATYPVDWWCKTWVIDKFDTWRNGGYIIYPKVKDAFKIKHVYQNRGHRPWTEPPKGSNKKRNRY